MKKMFVFLVFIALSCKGLESDKIVGRYYLVTTDSVEDRALSFITEDNSIFVDVVGGTVYSTGYDDKYIIAKQHPNNNKKIVNYFIVPIYKNFTYSPEKGVLGPLNENDFKNKCNDLKISNLKFTKTIED